MGNNRNSNIYMNKQINTWPCGWEIVPSCGYIDGECEKCEIALEKQKLKKEKLELEDWEKWD